MSQDIAEMVIQEQLQQIVSNIIEQVRILKEYIHNSQQDGFQFYIKINGIKSNVELIKTRLSEYIAKISQGLLAKEVYIEILKYLEKISQNIDATAYRLSILRQKSIVIEEVILSLIKSIIEKILESLDKLQFSIRVLLSNPKLSQDSVRGIIKLEEDVDELYRSFELKLFENNSNLIYVMLVKDIGDRLEDVADLLRGCADILHYLIFQRV
ncbi:MAG: phosphate transport regulator [Sulfolobaceae archaeon]